MSFAFYFISAVLYALSFPKFELSAGIFFFLSPLLYSIYSTKNKNKSGFFPFFVFAFISNIIILYWIPEVMVKYGGTSKILGIIALFALSVFLSSFTGIAGAFIKKVLNDKYAVFIIPMIWISKDLIIENIFNGFPWCFAGYSQYKSLYFIQIAEYGGIHIVSFIIIMINMLFFLYLKKRHKKHLIIILAVFGAVYGIGYLLIDSNGNIRNIQYNKVGIIQPNAYNESYSNQISFSKNKDDTLKELFSISKNLYKQGAEFIIWPEFTISIYPLQDRRRLEMFTDFTDKYVPILAGFTDYKSMKEIYNSAILFKKNGVDKYDKVHLVPFGEYVLFKDLLFFIKKITDQIGEFTPGKDIKNLIFNKHLISTPICYEIIFPSLVRRFIDNGGELLVTISNDSWYGTTSAPYQLLAMATFRSVENRRYNIRVTSNGISALISPTGKIIKKIALNKKDSFIAKFKYIKKKTFFTRYGYLFPVLNLSIVFLLFLYGFIKKKFTRF